MYVRIEAIRRCSGMNREIGKPYVLSAEVVNLRRDCENENQELYRLCR